MSLKKRVEVKMVTRSSRGRACFQKRVFLAWDGGRGSCGMLYYHSRTLLTAKHHPLSAVLAYDWYTSGKTPSLRGSALAGGLCCIVFTNSGGRLLYGPYRLVTLGVPPFHPANIGQSEQFIWPTRDMDLPINYTSLSKRDF